MEQRLPIYLSSTTSTLDEYHRYFGLIESPRSRRKKALDKGILFGVDNDAYNDAFSFELWLSSLDLYEQYKENCLFVSIPDVVGNAEATLYLFEECAHFVAIRELPVALVAQDGLTEDMVPWEQIDALFIGGTDEFKRNQSQSLIWEAKNKDKHVHVGRVNSQMMIRKFDMVDSWDGTMLNFDCSPKRQLRLVKAIHEVQEKQWK